MGSCDSAGQTAHAQACKQGRYCAELAMMRTWLGGVDSGQHLAMQQCGTNNKRNDTSLRRGKRRYMARCLLVSLWAGRAPPAHITHVCTCATNICCPWCWCCYALARATAAQESHVAQHAVQCTFQVRRRRACALRLLVTTELLTVKSCSVPRCGPNRMRGRACCVVMMVARCMRPTHVPYAFHDGRT